MGTDIHGVFQRYDVKTKQWQDVDSVYDQNRHYQLFAVLAGVRNGRGFAGAPTGEVVNPISTPRGLPEGFDVVDDFHFTSCLPRSMVEFRKNHPDFFVDEPNGIYMGYHDHSWLSGEEMLAWFQTAPSVLKVGVLSRETYETWDGASAPKSYAGDVRGYDVVIVADNAIEREKTPNWTYIRCEWRSDLSEELAYFFDEVARLHALHGQIRFVFGFDS